MSEKSEHELAQAIRELREAIGENTTAIRQLTGRTEKQELATTALTKTMERVHVRLASKLDADETTGFIKATNTRLGRLERAVFPNGE